MKPPFRQSAVPTFMYGTAWKEQSTAAMVTQALEAGFRAIDTANQRKHYHEAGVGDALRASFATGAVKRDDLFLQTKFTFRDGQDHRLPYDPAAPVTTQVVQSFARSLEHLGVSKIDSLVLHGPSQADGLAPADREAWRAMEQLVADRQVGMLGISNVTSAQLRELLTFANVAPSFVQNRCYASRDWDGDIRSICNSSNIVYQGFSLLTANRTTLSSQVLVACAARLNRTPEQIIFRFAIQLGILPLTGSSSIRHLRQDLEIFDFVLCDEDVALISALNH
jgi:diketogulonate reductase-like aldo/keto reductase